MGVREKMKRAFGGKKSGDSSPSDAETPKIPGVESYKPGELPRSKYRGKWDQDHQDKLHAFSFAAAFRSRRGSGYSNYSPAGTKAQSRRASYFSRKSKSDVDDKSLRRKSTNHSRVQEDVADKGDVASVGLSRPRTAGSEAVGGKTEHGALVNGVATNDSHLEKTATEDGTKRTIDPPFTVEELSRALTAAKLEEKELIRQPLGMATASKA